MKKRIFCLVLVLCMALTLLPASAFAATVVNSGTCGDNLTWTLDSEGTLTISGTGKMTDYDSSDAPWYSYRDSITKVVIKSGVTSIGVFAFSRCSSLTGISIPNSVERIGISAFFGCSSLTNIKIPSSVTSIGELAFQCCYSLVSIDVAADNPAYCSIDGALFDKKMLFLMQYPCSGTATSFVVPDSVVRIDAVTFADCVSLRSVTLPDGIDSIGERAFRGCYNLTEIRIPKVIQAISKYTFGGCTGLKTVTLYSDVKKIQEGAFSNCTALTDVYFSGTEAQWNAITFENNNDCLLNANIHFGVSQTGTHYTASKTIKPSCTEKDYTVYSCPCGYSYKADYSDALGHNFVNGECTRCKLKANPFTDVAEGAAYYDAVQWGNSKGIVSGFTATEFRPNNTCTRAQVVTFLWRAAGSPEPTNATNPFKDVSAVQANGKDNPFYKAILWGVENGITSGYSDGTFRPNDTVTRAQFVTFLWRYEGKPTSSTALTFNDASTIAKGYRDAVAWGVENGVIAGYGDNTFRPNATCTRWQVVLFMYRDMKDKL